MLLYLDEAQAQGVNVAGMWIQEQFAYLNLFYNYNVIF